ncbi:MAG: M15 family metallopeptidase [Acidimicrobiales bacterium]
MTPSPAVRLARGAGGIRARVVRAADAIGARAGRGAGAPTRRWRWRQALAVGGAAMAGTLIGVQATFLAQDAVSNQRSEPIPDPEAPGVDAGSMPAPSPTAPPPASDPQILLTWTRSTLDPRLEPAARADPEVVSVSMVRGAVADLVASRDAEGRVVQQLEDGWLVPLDAVAIDPVAHAAFAPLADRAAVAELDDGEVLLSRASAQLRGVGPGATLELANGSRLVVGAVVDNTTIGAAELAVTVTTGAEIGVVNPRYLLVEYAQDRAALEAALRGAVLGEVAVRFRAPGETPYLRQGDAVLPPARLKQLFGEFAYRPPGAGEREFEQDPGWQSEHVVQRDMPVLGRMRCHRAVADAIEGALAELQAANLSGLVDPAGFAGCWNPRLVQPDGDLSHHAWGVALDVNYEANPTCKESVQDSRLVDVFARWGFTWGGGWLCPDPAHFEYVAPPDT